MTLAKIFIANFLVPTAQLEAASLVAATLGKKFGNA